MNTQSALLFKKTVYQEDRMKLYRYDPLPNSTHKQTEPKTLLIIFGLVNRPSILDLNPDCSLIQDLRRENIIVYLIEWGDPLPQDSSLSLSRYINDYIKNCIHVISLENRKDLPHLMGICQGGVLSICYAALFPKTIGNLILVSTPIDFHKPKTFIAHILQSIDVNLLGKAFDNIPGSVLTHSLLWLNPFKIIRKKLEEISRVEKNPTLLDKFIQIEKWAHDCPDQPSKLFCEFINKFYKKNYLIKGKIRFGKQRVNLKNLTMPVLTIAAADDSLVPAASSDSLKKYVSPEIYTNKTYRGGHISFYVNDLNRHQIVRDIDLWLKRKYSNV